MTGNRVQLVEFGVTEYKSLRSVRVDLTSQMVLYGPNGSGKTTLLEAFALCFGSSATMWQLAHRAEQPKPGALATVVRGTPTHLPLAPAYCSYDDDRPRAADSLRSARLWTLLGADRAAPTWSDAIRSAIDDERVVQLLDDCGQKPLIRYRLEQLSGLAEARNVDRGAWVEEHSSGLPDVSFERSFSRTLCVAGPLPEWLTSLTSDLPDAFGPLRRWLDESSADRSPYADLLELPPTSNAPVRAVWLSSERTTAEAYFDLLTAWEAAAEPVQDLGEALEEVRHLGEAPEFGPTDDPGGTRFWLANRAAKTAAAAARFAAPGTEASADDDSPAEIALRLPSGSWSRLGELAMFEKLSSGERAWVDIGLARAAADLEAVAPRVRALADVLLTLDNERRFDLAVELEGQLDVFREDLWSAEDVDAVMRHAERRFGPWPGFAELSTMDEETRADLLTMYHFALPRLRDVLLPPATVHMYDEPERHLHPRAQRAAFAELSAPGESSVFLATHSHLFLGGPGWTHLHFDMSSEGTVVTAFDPADITTASAVARQMGLTRGELLARVSYVLFVEGPVDAAVLDGLYAEVLNEAGVLVLPFHGTEEVLSLAEMELIGNIVDVGAGVLADHVRSSTFDQSSLRRDASKEERALFELRKRLSRRRKQMDIFGLREEDIVAYLHDDAVREHVEGFPGWHVVRADRRKGEKLKDAAARVSGLNFATRHKAGAIAGTMRERSLAAPGDLPAVVQKIVAAASARDVA